MIWVAPTSRAAWMALSPTPPQPITATVCPARTFGAVAHRADPGQHRAAEQRGRLERHLAGDAGLAPRSDTSM